MHAFFSPLPHFIGICDRRLLRYKRLALRFHSREIIGDDTE